MPSAGYRTVVDVSYDAGSDALIVNSYTPVRLANGPYASMRAVWGTSAGAPQWARFVGIANEGWPKSKTSDLDGAGLVLPAIYSPPMAAVFNDIHRDLALAFCIAL